MQSRPGLKASGDVGSLRWFHDRASARRAVVIGAFIALCVSPLPIATQTIGLFVGPVTHEFGWSRTVFFMGPSLAAMISGVFLSFLGYFADRIGIRPILMTGCVVYGLCMMGMATLTGSVTRYIALCMVMYGVGLTQSSVLYAKAISQWFADRRGLMLSVAISGTGVGAIVLPLVAAGLIATFGWRVAYVVLGAIVIVVALPSVFFLVQEPSRQPRSDRFTDIAVGEGLSLAEAARTRTYWLLMAMFVAGNGALLSVVNNLVPVLTNHGISPTAAAAAMSALGVSQAMTRLLTGYVLDRTSTARLVTVWYVLSTAGVALLGFAHTLSAGLVAGLLVGAAWGAENELAAYFTGRYFGLRSSGTIMGTFFTAFIVTGTPVVLLTARLFDIYRNYDVALCILAGGLVLSCLFAALLGPYAYARNGFPRHRINKVEVEA